MKRKNKRIGIFWEKDGQLWFKYQHNKCSPGRELYLIAHNSTFLYWLMDLGLMIEHNKTTEI